jgi:hypothetical protein
MKWAYEMAMRKDVLEGQENEERKMEIK